MTTLLSRPAERLTELAGRGRKRRVFHPYGLILTGDLEAHGHPDWPEGTPVPPGPAPALVRMSKSLPTPGTLPDVLGFALRLPAADGVLDLLLATTGRLPLARHALLPRRDFLSGTYGSLLPYDVAGRTYVLAARSAEPGRRIPAALMALRLAAADRPLVFDLLAAPPLGRWRRWGRLTLGLGEPTAEPEFLDPVVNSLPGFHPGSPFREFRRRAYAGSRRGRGAPALDRVPERR